jgi:hypothetical protein
MDYRRMRQRAELAHSDTTPEERKLIHRIAQRALDEQVLRGPIIQVQLLITTAHCKAGKLRLKELLEAPAFDFAHDISGMAKHLSCKTGLYNDYFSPRYEE